MPDSGFEYLGGESFRRLGKVARLVAVAIEAHHDVEVERATSLVFSDPEV